LHLLELVETNPVVKSKSNLAGVHMELASILINLHQYGTAAEHIEQSLGLFKTGMINELKALEKLMFVHFRQADFTEAAAVLERAHKHKFINYSEASSVQWEFLHAAMIFEQGNPKGALKIIEDEKGFTKVKSAFLPGYYLLEILCHLEMEDYDWIYEHVEYLSKHLPKVNNRDDSLNGSQRLLLILRLLRSLVKYNFEYDTVLQREKAAIEQLQSGESQFFWDPVGYEIIRFEHWMLKKTSSASNR
jgi:tetratricopeptide (TPR) repeat protein